MTKALLIAQRLIWQNRWLFLLLMMWPYLMAAILLLPNGQPDADDVLSMLHQECFYGLALAAVTGATQLGNEQRSRRIIMVLSRAIGRPQYLLAIWMTAWLPLALYVSGFVVSGTMLASILHRPVKGVLLLAFYQLLAGCFVAALSVFWSVLLPSIFASIVSMASVAAAFWMGGPGPGVVITALVRMGFSGNSTIQPAASDCLLTVVSGGVFFAAACWLFHRRDLNLTAE